MSQKKRGLGRGLNELTLAIENTNTSSAISAISAPELLGIYASENLQLMHLPIEYLRPNPHQPRQLLDPSRLQELADSIRAQGIIQPIAVRRLQQGQYEIIAGERRWRAAQQVGLSEVPVVIHQVSDQTAMAMALIENIQRQDLNVVEEAIALQRLSDEFNLTHQQIAEIVGKSRTAISNLLRLLNLSKEVLTLLELGKLEMGHARALLTLDMKTQEKIARIVVDKQLSVRQTELLVRRMKQESSYPPQVKKSSDSLDPNIENLQRDLSMRLAAKINIHHQTSGKGKLTIHYNSVDELQGIIDHIH